MDVNMYLKHVMVDGCKWLLVNAYAYVLGTRSVQTLSYCIYRYVFVCKLNSICYHMWVAYGSMAVHTCSIYITRDACIHDWTHGTDMIRIKEAD